MGVSTVLSYLKHFKGANIIFKLRLLITIFLKRFVFIQLFVELIPVEFIIFFGKVRTLDNSYNFFML